MIHFDTEKMIELIARTWEDPDFKQLLLSNPKPVLAQAGIVDIPEDVEIEVLENTKERMYLVLPPASSESDDIGDADLEKILAGGVGSDNWQCDSKACTMKCISPTCRWCKL